MIEEWLQLILCLLESCFQELDHPMPKEQLRGPALEVLNYAIGNEKSPAIRLSNYTPQWPPQWTPQPDPKTLVLGMIATWVWHVVLNIVDPSKRKFFQQETPPIQLRYLAVSPCHHYRLLLGSQWPGGIQNLDPHEKIQPKNLLPTVLSLEEIQHFSAEVFEYPLSSLAVRQHTYRMRIELITLFYLFMGFKLNDIFEKLPGAPKSVIKASFGRVTRFLGEKNELF